MQLTEDFGKAKSSFFKGYDEISASQQRKSYLLSNETEFYLYLLDDVGFHSEHNKMQTFLSDDPGILNNARRVYRSLAPDFRKTFTKEDYVESTGIVKALKNIGLGVHGGVPRMCFLRRHSQLNGESFPINSIIVENAEKARDYIEIGQHLGSDIKLESGSSSINKVAMNHVRLMDTIYPLGAPEQSWTTLKKRILEATIGGQSEHVMWEYKRAKFRARIAEKSKQIFINKAVETKASIPTHI